MTVSARRRASGAQARRTGRVGEIVAAFWLMAKGWRILAANLKTHGVEIDLLARKGAVLAVVEVKARATLDAALAAVTPDQQVRLRRAGLALAARPQSEGLSLRLDLVALAPGRLPRHIPDAWPDVAVWQGVGSRS
ncbi:MAG: YraN family protein [Caulobacteraceae bacterium]